MINEHVVVIKQFFNHQLNVVQNLQYAIIDVIEHMLVIILFIIVVIMKMNVHRVYILFQKCVLENIDREKNVKEFFYFLLIIIQKMFYFCFRLPVI